MVFKIKWKYYSIINTAVTVWFSESWEAKAAHINVVYMGGLGDSKALERIGFSRENLTPWDRALRSKA